MIEKKSKSEYLPFKGSNNFVSATAQIIKLNNTNMPLIQYDENKIVRNISKHDWVLQPDVTKTLKTIKNVFTNMRIPHFLYPI